MHQPGFEPGLSAWEADVLPLDYWCMAYSVIGFTRDLNLHSVTFSTPSRWMPGPAYMSEWNVKFPMPSDDTFMMLLTRRPTGMSILKLPTFNEWVISVDVAVILRREQFERLIDIVDGSYPERDAVIFI